MRRRRPAVTLPGQPPEFGHGFEVGVIYQMLADSPRALVPDFPVHAENLDPFKALAARKGYYLSIDHVDEKWVALRFDKIAELPKDGPLLTLMQGGKSEDA